ncbi:Starch-binding associating with outer membrane [Paenimyroides ummariense]|uniref:Starch-binding associating with outer membrane n=1 Tax=Paenimyroides ummariense TaxID=913024 RepID=A0A1I5BNI8_9FLAO|nr:RagB/SusD family nutrient uptake outer membrane protein [Paenimyroides ummariense]SFN76227.1 Starch-binding associating with outer membrane [Paenimyroides ummariense]
MKNKVLILLFAIGGLVTSCSDAYDIQQKGEINDAYEAFRTPQDIARGVNAIYSSIPANTEINLGSIFTDEVAIGLDNGGQGLISGEYGFFMEAGSSYASSLWGSYYTIINRINRLEEIAVNLKKETPALSGDFDNVLAELYVLRAFAHYKLFAYFTPDYTNGSGKSAIILDHVPPYDYSYSLPRNTVNEVKKFILDDLQTASTIRQTGWVDGSNYVNAAMIEAIRVKLYAMTGDWDKVLEHGQVIMNRYRLATATEYKKLFARVTTTQGNFQEVYAEPPALAELIFKLNVTLNTGPSVVGNWYSIRARGGDGSPFYEMGRSLYNELDKLDPSLTGTAFGSNRNDMRYEVNLLPDLGTNFPGTKVLVNYESASQSEYNANDILLIGKYLGMDGANLKNNIHIFRVADILLAMAEARAAKGELLAGTSDPNDLLNNYNSVESILYSIRWNRSKNTSSIAMPSITNQQSAFAAILNERRVELSFEGHRYLDMKRLGTKAGSPGFTRYSKDCAVNGACNLPTTSYKMTLPIPVGEMNGNNSLTADSQNPGY